MRKLFLLLLVILFIVSSCDRTSSKISICKNIQDSYSQLDCYINISIDNDDSSICDNLNDSRNRDICLTNVQDWCILKISATKFNSNQCGDISGDFRDKCFKAVAKNDSSKCEKELPLICEKITNLHDKEVCLSFLASVDKDLEKCNRITNSYTRELCYMEVARIKENTDICLQANSDAFFTNTCIEAVARDTKDLKICDKMQDEKERNWCYDEVHWIIAKDKNDIKMCDQIVVESTKNLCYQDIKK